MIDSEKIYNRAYAADMDASLGREPSEAHASALREVLRAGYVGGYLDGHDDGHFAAEDENNYREVAE